MSTLVPAPAFARLLERSELRTVQDVLERAEWIRDLPDRANLRLALGDGVIHVKLTKPRRPGESVGHHEGTALAWASARGLPVPRLVFHGVDPERGAVAGTLDLAPARPLDALLRAGALTNQDRRRLRVALAAAVARLHDLGYHHRDLYLNHVYVDPARENPLAAIIDWDRCGPHRFAYGRWVVKDLAALIVSTPQDVVGRAEQMEFLINYLVLRGRPKKRLLRRLARRVERKASRMRRHVPRTPVGEAARPQDPTA